MDYGALPSRIELSSIWGSSSTDVWGAAGDAADVRDCLWHYDGVKWSRATEGTPITDYSGNNAVYAVWGTAKNNVWAFGRKISAGKLSAFIMHYDGISWKDATTEDVRQIAGHLYDVHGVSENNIWVAGYQYALHYNGVSWMKYKVADSIIVGSIATNDRNVYLNVYSPWGKNINLVYRLEGEKFRLVDSTHEAKLKFGGLFWATNSKLFSLANGVISTDVSASGDIDTLAWRKEFSTPTFFSERIVQSPKNIVAVGQWNLVYHFNGSDWAPIQISVPNHTVHPYALFWGVWTDGNELFICDTDKGIVYHGR
ncbi:MAG: hypothetical protein KBF97_05430 [Bacteroidetes bacterium]|nr:hypothetical protein [Bacteroidota bacterium]